jgi:Glycogen debranching enzyme
MFAGLTGADGRVGACLFYEPKMLVDDTVLFDYSLFFISCLYDYYEATKDIEFIREMWPTAVKQIRLSEQRLDKSGLLKDSEDWWCFLDWGNNLNKQAGAQGVFLYTVKQAVCLSQILEDKKEEQNLLKLFEILKQAAWTSLWDKDKELFISGQDRQVSTVSQIWMLLSGIVEEEKANSIIQKLLEQQTGIPLETPYMHHYYVEALLLYGKQNEAIHIMMEYWGGMLTEETDTFWELYNPNDLKFSPYGSNVVNSYCHAWSCTPAYFIRKYQLK